MKNWKYINGAQVGNEKLFYGLEKDVEKKEEKNDEEIEKVGNAGYPMLKSKVEELSKEGKSYEEVVNELLKFGFTRADIAQYEGYIREHIGNKKIGNANYRYKGYLITKSDEDGEIIVFKPNGRDVAFRGTKSEDMAKDWIDHHSVGNKTGNAYTEADRKRLYALAQKQKTTKLSDAEWKEFQDLNRREEEASKELLKRTGNSASDDKFAYVMREFDEGKLKTPDGKVVTDPAQAKAIAYSESKKTENGCARARNAMKCGNKEVTLWKGNDSVLIKSDGTVLYLESNSFENDRDKFDSQETAVKEMAKQGYKSK